MRCEQTRLHLSRRSPRSSTSKWKGANAKRKGVTAGRTGVTLKGRTAKAKTSRSVKEFKVDVEVGPKVDVEVGPAARTQNDCFDPVCHRRVTKPQN